MTITKGVEVAGEPEDEGFGITVMLRLTSPADRISG